MHSNFNALTLVKTYMLVIDKISPTYEMLAGLRNFRRLLSGKPQSLPGTQNRGFLNLVQLAQFADFYSRFAGNAR